MLLNTTILKL